MLKAIGFPVMAVLLAGATSVQAAPLSTNARTAIPRNVQQLLAVDYRAMQNSTAAMELRNRLIPPELKSFDAALQKSGLNDNHDVEQLAFAFFRPNDSEDKLESVGIAQGQFPVRKIQASFLKQGFKATLIRTNQVYPLGKTGMVACFIDPSTMVFGNMDAVRKALDVHDSVVPGMLADEKMVDAMNSVDSEPLWSILDQKGTDFMVRQFLGSATSVTNFDSARKHLQSSRYAMDFEHGVRLNLSIETGDNLIAGSFAAILSAVIDVRRMNASDTEKQALNATAVSADAGRLSVRFAASDEQFNVLLHSSLFQGLLV